MHPYVALWLWTMKWLLRIAGPLYLIAAVVLVVYGTFSRIPEHDAVLKLSGYEFPILIGISDRQRSYVVIPRVFHRPSIITVNEVAPSHIERTESPNGFFVYLVALAVAAWGSWRFLIQPRRLKSHVVPSA